MIQWKSLLSIEEMNLCGWQKFGSGNFSGRGGEWANFQLLGGTPPNRENPVLWGCTVYYLCLKHLSWSFEHFHQIHLNFLSLSRTSLSGTSLYLEQTFWSYCNYSLPISNFVLACSVIQVSYRVSYENTGRNSVIWTTRGFRICICETPRWFRILSQRKLAILIFV